MNNHSRKTPTVVAFTPQNERLFGEPASVFVCINIINNIIYLF